MYDLVIWDFNGTIADDVAIGIEAANTVLSRRGMKTIDSVESYREMFCFPIINYYRKLGFTFETEPYEVPADEWTAEYIAREGKITLTLGCKSALEGIKDRGIKQIIISSSEIVMLRREAKMLGVDGYFDDILGKDDNYAHGKVEMAKAWANGKDYNALFIGDSKHDFDTARAIGADVVLFSGGHDSRSHLEECGVPIVDSLDEVLRFL